MNIYAFILYEYIYNMHITYINNLLNKTNKYIKI